MTSSSGAGECGLVEEEVLELYWENCAGLVMLKADQHTGNV